MESFVGFLITNATVLVLNIFMIFSDVYLQGGFITCRVIAVLVLVIPNFLMNCPNN